jgi:hypothetical protein
MPEISTSQSLGVEEHSPVRNEQSYLRGKGVTESFNDPLRRPIGSMAITDEASVR